MRRDRRIRRMFEVVRGKREKKLSGVINIR